MKTLEIQAYQGKWGVGWEALEKVPGEWLGQGAAGLGKSGLSNSAKVGAWLVAPLPTGTPLTGKGCQLDWVFRVDCRVFLVGKT